jgi:protein-S-isoprenylcysteine O-methyltransferase Ste14
MTLDPLKYVGYCWVLLGLFWLAGMLFTKPTQRVQSPGGRLFHVLPSLAGAALLGGYFFRGTWLDSRFIANMNVIELAGLAVTAAGCLFAAGARLMLGENWSGRPTVRAGHKLIVEGPYALVRHPIYTGFVVALAGTTLACGQWRSVIGFAIVLVGLLIKMRQEERMMMQTFPQDYPEYRRRVKALIPGVF